MELDHHLAAIRQDLAAAAALGGEAIGEAAGRLGDALEPSLRLRLLDLLTEVALDLSGQLATGHVELRLAGREPQLLLVAEPEEAAEPPPAGDELSARITLRLPEGLKSALEEAAGREGISTNAWIVRALGRALERRPSWGHRGGNRLQGFARS
jgi:hypothetical protein